MLEDLENIWSREHLQRRRIVFHKNRISRLGGEDPRMTMIPYHIIILTSSRQLHSKNMFCIIMHKKSSNKGRFPNMFVNVNKICNPRCLNLIQRNIILSNRSFTINPTVRESRHTSTITNLPRRVLEKLVLRILNTIKTL